ncbi:hypothetical protein [Aestuariivita boseongensis]|uniref:hypothetical protein n=1 Tax=Aestuariivita boseongensis TaxID=1470562 RepID=UPI00155DAEB5|nr:hypothetical protein [Aestuariivita boseongensis]
MSSVAVFVEWQDLKPEDWNLLSGQVDKEVYSIAITVLIVYLVLALIVHWTADFVAFKKWFKSNRVEIGTMAAIGPLDATETPLQSFLRRLQGAHSRMLRQVDSFERILRSRSQSSLENGDEQTLSSIKEEVAKAAKEFQSSNLGLEELTNLANELTTRFRDVSLMAKIVVFGWYLLLPLATAMIALLLTNMDFA